jgi:hypothetical protein
LRKSEDLHPDLFTEELEQALQIIAALPGARTFCAHVPFPAFAASTSGESPSISITRSMTPA